MIPVRIICTYDAVKTAQTLARVLSAEGRQVDVNHGRGAVALLHQARVNAEAVVLIWSLDAQSATYMWDWQNLTDPARLIEIARGPAYPSLGKRRAPVLDFSAWNGERGGPAWRALHDRLRTIGRPYEPARPAPKHAAMALGAVSVLAVGAALVVRVQEALQPDAAPQADRVSIADAGMLDGTGLGGPLRYMEPASADDIDVRLNPMLRAELAPSASFAAPMDAHVAGPVSARAPQLLERLGDLAEPLLNREEPAR